MRWALLSACLCMVLGACRATPPVGIFACSDDFDCPLGQRCFDGLCDVRRQREAPLSSGGTTSAGQSATNERSGAGAPASSEAGSVAPAPGTGGSVAPAPAAAGSVAQPSAASGASIASAGEACSTPNSTACGGQASAQVLRCDGTQWQRTSVCAEGQRCDTRPAAPAGTCKPIAEGCKDKKPGDTICNAQTVQRCGPDLLTIEHVKLCEGIEPLCRDGACTCPNRCPSGCVDTKLDTANCGGCGHSCLVTLCNAGFCEAELLADKLGQVSDLMVSGLLVFATMTDGILQIPLGGNAPRFLRFPNCFDMHFEYNEYLYTHCSGSGFVRISLLGGMPPQVLSATSVTSPVLYGDSIYFAVGTKISRMPASGGAASVVAELGEQPNMIAVDDRNFYWTALGAAAGKGFVKRMAIAGGEATVIALEQSSPYWIFSNGKHVYWGNSGPNGYVSAAPVAGNGPGFTLTTGEIQDMTIDDVAVYFAKRGMIGKALWGVPESLKLASPTQTARIAVDEAFVYWTEFDGTAAVLKRVAK